MTGKWVQDVPRRMSPTKPAVGRVRSESRMATVDLPTVEPIV